MKRFNLIVSAIVLAAGLAAPLVAQATLPPEVNGQAVPSLAPMLTKVLPCIVNVSTVGVINPPSNPFAQPNSKKQASMGPRKFTSMGSGVIVDAAKGYVLTNAHVIRQAQTITVTLKDGTQRIAKVIGVDSASDVAVLQIPPQGLTAIPISDSDKLQVGDFVVAIGNPFGLNQTVTSGIVSALQRTDLGIEGYENFIQTDAPINPGNSGGALVNLQGQLVGINTAILAPDGGNVGIGFAIPSNMARSIMDQLIEYGSVRRGLLGIMIQSLNPTLADALNVPNTTGVVVTEVTPNSPAEKAGVQTGDIIESVNNQPVSDAVQITNIVGLLRVGDTVTVKLNRAGKQIDIPVVIASPKDYLAASEAQNPLLFGMNLRDFNQMTALNGQIQGVQITGIAEQSPAFTATPIGLRPGDVIVSANSKPVQNMNDLINIAKGSKQLVLNVMRGNGAMFIVIK